MISVLFFARFRPKSLLIWLLAALVLGAGAGAAYLPSPLEQLRFLRGEMPELFTVLGFVGDSNLPAFVLSALYGLLLPILANMQAVSLGRHLLARPLADGRLAQLLAAPHARASVMLLHFLALAVWIVLTQAACLAGQMLSAVLLFPVADLTALSRLSIGFIPTALLLSAFCCLLALVSPSEARYARRARLLLALMLILAMAGRLSGWTRLRLFSVWSLFDGRSLAFGAGGWGLAGLAGGLTLVCLAAALLYFQQREL
jgi:hypothetical protein